MLACKPITIEQLYAAVEELCASSVAPGQLVFLTSVCSLEVPKRTPDEPPPEVRTIDVQIQRDRATDPWRYEGELVLLDGELYGIDPADFDNKMGLERVRSTIRNKHSTWIGDVSIDKVSSRENNHFLKVNLTLK